MVKKMDRQAEGGDRILVAEARLDQMERQLRELQAQRTSRQEQIAQLESGAERGFMIAARVNKDASAQAGIDRLEKQIADLRREELQDYGATAELSAELEKKGRPCAASSDALNSRERYAPSGLASKRNSKSALWILRGR